MPRQVMVVLLLLSADQVVALASTGDFLCLLTSRHRRDLSGPLVLVMWASLLLYPENW